MRKMETRVTAVRLAASIITVLLIASTSLYCAVAPRASAPAVDRSFDGNRTGSITLYKLLENGTDGALTEGLGVEGQQNARTGMPDIVFRGKKIAEITTMMVRGDDNSVHTGVYFTSVDGAFLTAYQRAVGRELSGAVRSEQGTVGFDTQLLIDAVTRMQKSTGDGTSFTGETLLKEVALGGDVIFPATDASGKTARGGLPLGLYLIAEDEGNSHYGEDADPAAAIAGPATPFLISLPMTSLTQIGGEPAGNLWQYDVTAYPKNSVMTVSKYIVSGDDHKTLVRTDDWQIGDGITQVITAEAPKMVSVSGDGTAKMYKSFQLRDTMSAGLEYVNIKEVRLGAAVRNPKTLGDFSGQVILDRADYRRSLSGDGSVLTLALESSGLAKLNALQVDGMVSVVFETRLNARAVIAGENGSDGINQNRPGIRWQTRTDVERELEGNPVQHFTYGINLTKTGVTDYSAVAFSMQRGDGGPEMNWIKEKDGVYHPSREGETGGTSLLLTDSGGMLSMRGLDSGVYVLTERRTQKGRTLLTSPVRITLTGKEKPDGILSKATASVNGSAVELPVFDSGRSGIAMITIANHGQVVLKAGGGGKGIFSLAAVFILASVAGVSILIRRRGFR